MSKLNFYLSGPVRLGVTGTYDLEWLKAQRGTPVVKLPQAEVERIVETELTAHNARAEQMIAAYAERVSSRDGVDATGQLLTGEMERADENSRVRTQVNVAPQPAYFPLDRYQASVGFTADFLREATGNDLVLRLENAQARHRGSLIRAISERLLSPFSYQFQDYMDDNKLFTVNALYNADGVQPPVNGNLVSFNGTHTHYTGFTALTEANFRAVLNNVREHTDGNVELHVAAADEGTIRTFPGFTAAIDAQIIPGSGVTTTRRSVGTNPNNRYIGRFEGADVLVKPWIPDHYAVAEDMDNPALGIRGGRRGIGLYLAGTIATFPLQSDYLQADFGVGVRRRGAAAVAQFNSAAAGQYTDPTNAFWKP